MGKYKAVLFERFCFLKQHYYLYCGVVIEFIILHYRYLKYMTQPLLILVMMKMRWTIDLKALAVKLIGSLLVKQQIG